MKLGAHVSTAGGVHNAVDRAQEIGAEAIQIFASSPRAWAFKPPKEEHLLAFHEKSREIGLGPIFLHGSYLVNVGGTPELVEANAPVVSPSRETSEMYPVWRIWSPKRS